MHDPAVQLRSATPRDAATLAALSIQVFLDTYATEGVRPDLAAESFAIYSAEAFAQRLHEPARHFILAEQGCGLLGFAEVLLARLPVPAGTDHGAELVRLYVQPRAQRAGLGRTLLARAERLAREWPLSSLWLTAWEGNASALAFYRRMGYVDIGATSYTLQGNTYGNRVLAKSLS